MMHLRILPLVAVLVFALPALAREAPRAPDVAVIDAAPVAPAAVDLSLPAAAEPSLDFDFLEPAAPVAVAPEQAQHDALMGRRRLLLGIHQTAGLALFAAMAGTMISGQLNYSDRFGAAASGRYEATHRAFAYTTVGLFGTTGALALFAPVPPDKQARGIDRVFLHRVGMFGAAAGMAAQVILGIATSRSDGLARQQTLAKTHLAVGYATLGFMTLGVASIVF